MSGLTRDQLVLRRTYLGGTSATRIMRGEWRALWREQTGHAEREDLSNVLRVQLGVFTEPFNRHWFEKQTSRKVEHWGQLEQHPTIPYMAANIDGMTTTAAGLPAVWDAKHVGAADDRTVQRYVAQMTHNALVTGVDWWVISFLVGNSRWEMVEAEIDPMYAEDVLDREREFWGYVERDEEPQDRDTFGAPLVRKTLRTVALDEAQRAAWPNWGPAMADEMSAWARTNDAATAHEVARRHIKELIPEDVGLVTRGQIRIARDKAGAIRITLI